MQPRFCVLRHPMLVCRLGVRLCICVPAIVDVCAGGLQQLSAV